MMGSKGAGSAIARTIGWTLAGSAASMAWLAGAQSALAATEVAHLADIAADPRVLTIMALLVIAAWLGFAGTWRTGHRHH